MKIVHTYLLMIFFASCKYVTYTPKTKMQKFMERPSPLIFDRMVDFRIEQKSWPVSKTDFISKGKKYYESFENFPYLTTQFKIIDSNRMTFYFSDHIKELNNDYNRDKVDLNAYGGYVKFHKEADKFIWKLKMN